MKRYYHVTLTTIDQYRDDFLMIHSCYDTKSLIT